MIETPGNPISPKVHRSLYNYAVKKFLADNVEEFNYVHNSDDDELVYSHLLDGYIEDGTLEDIKVEKFLIEQINYGRMRNMYVSFLSDVSHLVDEHVIRGKLHNLKQKGYDNANLIKGFPFVNNIRGGLDRGKKEVIYSDIKKNNDAIVSVKFVIAIGTLIDGVEVNNYIAAEINLELKMLILKIRNWEPKDSNYSVEKIFEEIHHKVLDAFDLIILKKDIKMSKLIYSMVKDLSNKVLEKPMNFVNEKIEKLVENNVSKWCNAILDDDITQTDLSLLKTNILNSYYKFYMNYSEQQLGIDEYQEKLSVDGYPRYVKFKDETISEARAKSPSPHTSLVSANVFYDVKASLDHAEELNMATVYWLKNKNPKTFGVSYHTDYDHICKLNILPNYFDEEICDYVLRKIKQYMQTS